MAGANKRKGTTARAPGKRPRRTPQRYAESETTRARVTVPATVTVGVSPTVDFPDDLGPTSEAISGNDASGKSSVIESDSEGGIITESHTNEMTSVFDDIEIHVPLKLKEKIWEGKFIDLGILNKSSHDIDREFEGEGELIYRDGKLSMQKKFKEQTKLTINSWTSAFLIYVSVMLKKYPGKAQGLLKYMRDIRLLSSRSLQWWVYDEQFRYKKARYPDSSWGIIDQELWIMSALPARDSKAVPSTSTQQNGIATDTNTSRNSSSFRNFNQNINGNANCWAFNKGRQCRFHPRCKFPHACSKCGGQHPAYQCKG